MKLGKKNGDGDYDIGEREIFGERENGGRREHITSARDDEKATLSEV